MKSKPFSTKDLTILGILGALIIIMGYTPLGLIPLPGMTATILHVPVIIGALVLGPKLGIYLGGIMGLTTFTRAFLAPMGPMDLFFRNPLISILPRLFIGLLAYFSYLLVKKWLRKEVLALTIGSIIGSISNTFFTLGMLTLLYYKDLSALCQSEMGVSVFAFLGIILTTSAIGECIITGILAPAITLTLFKARLGGTFHVTSN